MKRTFEIMKEKVLVTGISGYIGQHIAEELLKQGYSVVGTVRSLNKAMSTKASLASVVSIKKLDFAEADLLSDKGWDKAMHGCTFVLHVASPFVLAEPKNEGDLIDPAVEGTKRVIAAAKRAGVKRLVITSSIFSIIGGKESGTCSPEDWSDTNKNIGAYAKSKTLGERAAWEAAKGSQLEIVAILPGAVFGPPISGKAEGQSAAMIQTMINGKMPMIPDIAMGMVDVRDVARLQVKALTAKEATGKRFIAASSEPVSLMHLAKVLKDAGFTKVPTRKAPTIMVKIMGMFDREARGSAPILGKKVTLKNQETFDILEWKPTPIEKSIVDMANAIAN